MPTLADFLANFVYGLMGITTAQLPETSPWQGYAFGIAMAITNPVLAQVVSPASLSPPSWTIYQLAVYNLAGDRLLNFAPDNPLAAPPDNTFFTDTRKSLNLTNTLTGVVQGAADQGTSTNLIDPDVMKGLTIGQLQNLKTTYGATYLGLAQSVGTAWGLT